MAEIEWTNADLKKAGISRERLQNLILLLEECSAEMREMGLGAYCGGDLQLWHFSRPHHRDGPNCEADRGSVIAAIDGPWDGGDW